MSNFDMIKYFKYVNKNNGGRASSELSQNDFRTTHAELINTLKQGVKITSDIKGIGEPSANGFIKKFQLSSVSQKNSSPIDILMKCSKKINADNNYYEFLVGKCINIFKDFLPNFAYTYKYLTLTPELSQVLQANKLISTENNENIDPALAQQVKIELAKAINAGKLVENVNLNSPKNIEDGCVKNDVSGLLLEFINPTISLDDLCQSLQNDPNMLNYELFNIVFQLYIALYGLTNVYTHYDLHLGNVMFSKRKSPVRLEYDVSTLFNVEDKIVLFTQYIPIIIDYGRSFVNCTNYDLSDPSISRVIVEKACATNCNTSQGNGNKNCDLYPYGFFVEEKNNMYSDQKNLFYIDIRNYNGSHDLRYIYSLLSQSNLSNTDLVKNFNKLKIPGWFVNKETFFGVPETDRGDAKISNIEKCVSFLLNYYLKNYTGVSYEVNETWLINPDIRQLKPIQILK